jgi:hypothetical protein
VACVEGVQGQALGVGEQGDAAGLPGLQDIRAARGGLRSGPGRAAASHQPVAAIMAASAKAVMTWSRNSQPIVGTVR